MVALGIDMLTAESIADFWSRVDLAHSDECWLWRGRIDRWGYGHTSVSPWNGPATHVSLTLNGRIRPDPKAEACHTCDNPQCVNPDHLWWGSHKENVLDAVRKGRMRGAKSWKVTGADMEEIRTSDLSIYELSRKFRISTPYVRVIRKGGGPANPSTSIKRPRDSKRPL